MYKLTAKMEQDFRNSLAKYHELFDGRRCQGWELEELLVRAIKSDNQAQHLPKWIEGGHDDKEDILVVTNGKKHPLQIKSGQIKGRKDNRILALSGHRLGRFSGDFQKISEYLNQRTAQVLSIPYRQEETKLGRKHIYRICYIDVDMLKGVTEKDWQQKGAQWFATNGYGVTLSVRPSMSWQIWWHIPLEALDLDPEFTDGQFI